MDFERVITLVGEFLDRGKIRWAMCGGLGLAASGLARTTFNGSSPPSDAADPQIGAEAGAEDAAALARLDKHRDPSLLEHPNCLAPPWPAPPDLTRRPTAEGRDPFEL